jgi:hypothetical protein
VQSRSRGEGGAPQPGTRPIKHQTGRAIGGRRPPAPASDKTPSYFTGGPKRRRPSAASCRLRLAPAYASASGLRALGQATTSSGQAQVPDVCLASRPSPSPGSESPAASCQLLHRPPPPRGVWIISGFGFRCMFCPLSVVLWALFILCSLCWFNSMYATCCSSYIIPL